MGLQAFGYPNTCRPVLCLCSSNSIFPQADCFGCNPAAVLILCSIMLSCGIHILMSQHIRHQINVPRLLVERSSLGTPQLMRRNFFQRRYFFGILLYQVFHGSYTNAASLSGVEECPFMPFLRNYGFPASLNIMF